MKFLLITLFSLLVSGVSYAARPTVQSSNLSYNNLHCNSVNLTWTSGNGAARVIVAKQATWVDFNPADGDQFTANPTFQLSAAYGPGSNNYIVYNADGTNFVKVNGLLPGKTYCFAIYEHDNNGTSTQYLVPADTVIVTTHTINLDFSIKVIDSCQNTNRFEFTNNSTSTIPNISYTFDFGDATSQNSPVTHKFSGGGGFKDIKLIPQTNLTGCPNLFRKNVKVFPKKIGFIDESTYKDSQCLDDNYFEISSFSPLMPFPMGVTYHWWFGDGTESTFPKMKKKYMTSGTFNVMLELNSTSYSTPTACLDTIFFQLTVLPSPVGNIKINDTIQCLSKNRFDFENPDNTLTYFKWYFGDNDSSDLKDVSHVYDAIGTYDVTHVAFAKSGCKGRDTVTVKVLPDLDSKFGGLDTVYCSSADPIQLNTNVDSGYFVGYGVNEDNELIPDVPGTYTLQHVVRDIYCSDTTEKSFTIYSTPEPDLGKDIAICNVNSYILNSNFDADKYLWSTGDTTKSITVFQGGIYTVEVTEGVCTGEDEIEVVFAKAPVLNIGGDTTLCKGGGLWLNASFPKSTYKWNTGSTDSMIYADQPGEYKVTVTNPCGETTDSVTIYFQNEYCDLFMANAFSPGNDAINNVFLPRGRNITVTSFSIYNRWGELIFYTEENNVGWDGTFEGEIVQEGLYLWTLTYNIPQGPFIKKSNAAGHILLLR